MSIPNTLTNHDAGGAISGRWLIDPRRSSVEFRVGYFWGLLTVKGHFDDYHGELDLSANPAIELTINAASVQTRNRTRDRHLRSADFFNTKEHPRVRFVADTVAQQTDTLKVRGHLSVSGRSIPLELDARVHRVGDELDIEAAATAPHRELGMTYSPLGMIASRSRLLVRGRLTLQTDRTS
jgi:polyisoprenoid-binding protein YceI